ncbi:MAG TPA: hypothetical protein ENJ35_09940 [Gammaproteobacteria bacterium]|nr:hypothetical protein [Gammaproteobacteria bacterium]
MTDTTLFPLSEKQIAIIRKKTTECITKANKHYKLKLQPLDIHFDVHGTSWGYFVRKNGHCLLRYNPTLFARHFREGLEDTIPHEVAHYVVDQRFQRRRKPHGVEWREVMRLFGIENPRATHQTPLDGLDIRRQRRYVYYCGCGETRLSATRHNRIVYKGARYFCRKCKQPLSPEK